MRILLKIILKILAKRVIARYQPKVIGVTGSVGKTTAKEAIYALLRYKFNIWKTEDNFNNEIGLPMTILGVNPRLANKGNKFGVVLHLIRAVWLAYGWPRQNYPKVLVLEIAADRPGDLNYLVDIAKPQIGVVTAVGEVPVHVEFYASPKAVAKEKSILIESLPSDGLSILNYDDDTVLDMREKSKAHVTTIGFSEHADIWASDVSFIISDDERSLGGLSFKVHQGESFMPFRINNLIGLQQVYAILAAVAVGIHFNINMVEISSILESFELPADRMNLMRGIKNTTIINDVYNASPTSMHAALDTLRIFGDNVIKMHGRGRKIAVLGDMRELGKYSEQAHRDMGLLTTECADILITVGTHSKLLADSAMALMGQDKIFVFSSSDDAKLKVQELIEEGDIILVKGSRGMHMEKILEEIVEN